jgi:translation initiation factor IF-2
MAPRRVQYDAKSGAGAGPAGQRRGAQMSGPNNRGGVRGGPARRGIGALAGRRPLGTAASVTQERSAHKKIVKIEGNIAVQALAGKMGIKGAELLMKLLGLGMTGVNINTTLDSDTAKIVSAEFGWTVEDVAVSEDAAIAAAQGGETAAEDGERVPRPPVVTVMGHVDHGKTSLLDKIRKAQVASGEAGGITQHIGAYSVKTPQGRITFLDTPGHEAFTQMRARGAKCTDIVVLVVAADDGVMPQTKEAINHARDANCPIVVAINKIDKPEAQPDRVRRELSEVGLMPEEWGGDTLFCEVSAHSGAGIEQLLDTILLQAEVLDLRANPNRHARGTVIEAKLDRGRGPVATVLVLEGTLRKGDGVLVGNSWGRVRAMLDDSGRNLADAGPATPVAIIGLSEVPSAGDNVDAVDDAKKAQQIAEQRKVKVAEKARGSTTKVSLEELARRMSQADQKDLKVIVKADVQGSVEALNTALEKLSTDKVKVTVVHSGVGAITEGDVNLAVASGALIIGFNTRPAGKARDLAQREGIEIRQYSVIYDVTDDVRASMEGLLAPTLVEEPIGEAEVRRIFKVSKAGVVAGCMVIKGVVRRNSMVRLRRNDSVIWEGKLDSLKRFKDDAKEVREGFDCGISFQGYSDLQEGDLIAAFEMKEVRPTL